MKLKIKKNHVGVMILNDGKKINYRTIRVTKNMSKLIYYTNKGLREIIKPNMSDEAKQKAKELKKQDEKILIKSGHIAEILLSEIKELN